MPAIELTALTYSYPGCQNPALNGVSLGVQPGEFLGVVGANHAGKSTLCLCLAGIIPHLYPGRMTGQVRINGVDTAETTVSGLARQVGLVMQNPGSQLSGIRDSVFGEVAFALENQGMDPGEICQRTLWALELTGLGHLAERSPFHLSGGEQQRLALASVLVFDPLILVLDEPTAFLDPQGTGQVFEILRQLNARGKTVVMAEQRLEWLAEFAARVVVLEKGAILLDDTAEAALTADALALAGLDSTRYTQVARLAQKDGLWDQSRPISASFSRTVQGLLKP